MNIRDNIARLVGEGYDQPQGNQSLPLDISHASVNEWLVDRKLVPKDWGSRVRALQGAAIAAGADPPRYDVVKARATALATGSERTLLGGLKGEAKTWDALVRGYEARNLHVAEAAQRLARDADYEVPALKRGMARAQQQIADLEKRREESRRGAARAEEAYREECMRLGVPPGGDPRSTLAALASRQLPGLLEECLECLREAGVGEGVEYYASFVASAAAGGDALHTAPLLAVLREVRAGETPAQAAVDPALGTLPRSEESPHAPGEAPAQDDTAWAGGLEALQSPDPAAADGIAWDLDLGTADGEESAGADEATGAVGGISWDVEVEAGGGEGGSDTAPSAIAWDIELDASEAADAASPAPHAVEGSPAASQANLYGGNTTAQRLAEDETYRATLLDDLHELAAFLRQRRVELESGAVDSSLAASAAGAAEVAAWSDAAQRALRALSAPGLQHLLLLRSSPSFLARQAAALESKRGAGPRLHGLGREAEQRRGTVQRGLVADSAALATRLQDMRAAKQLVEGALGTALRRRVLVVGEVNVLLAAAE